MACFLICLEPLGVLARAEPLYAPCRHLSSMHRVCVERWVDQSDARAGATCLVCRGHIVLDESSPLGARQVPALFAHAVLRAVGVLSKCRGV